MSKLSAFLYLHGPLSPLPVKYALSSSPSDQKGDCILLGWPALNTAWII